MSFNVAMLEAMREEGLDLDACIRVFSAGEKRADPTAAERKRRQREKEKAERDTSQRDVTRDGVSKDKDIQTFPESKKSEPKGSSKKFVLPADIPADPWDGWEDMRRRIHKPPTNRARSLAITELRRLRDEEGWPPGDVLNHCTMNSYQGIFPPRKQRDDRSDRDQTTVALERLLGGNAGAHAGTG